MKRHYVSLSVIVAIVGLALLYVTRKPASKPPALAEKALTAPEHPMVSTPSVPTVVKEAQAVEVAQPTARTNEPKPRYARLTVEPGQPIPELFPFQAERDHLLNLAASQDPRKIPTIAASLSHPDATVRATARQALVQLGDASAIPALQEAAKASKLPEEAALLVEAADFLSLPHFMDVIGNPNPPASGLVSAP